MADLQSASHSPQGKPHQHVAETTSLPLAHSLARETQKGPSVAPSTRPAADTLDPDLANLIDLWPDLPAALRSGLARWRELPEPIRTAVLALVAVGHHPLA